MKEPKLVLILGTGFLGRNFAEYFALKGIPFVMVGRANSCINLGRGRLPFPDHDFKQTIPDIFFPCVPKVVINTIGEIDHKKNPVNDRLLIEKKTILRNLFRNKQIVGAKKIIFFGTDRADDTAYVRSKKFESCFSHEKSCQHGIYSCEIKLRQCYGAFMKPERLIEAVFLSKILHTPLKITDPDKMIHPIFVGDLLVFVSDLMLGSLGQPNKVEFNSHSAISVKQLTVLVETTMKTKIFPAYHSSAAFWGAYRWQALDSTVTGVTGHFDGISRYLSTKQCIPHLSQ